MTSSDSGQAGFDHQRRLTRLQEEMRRQAVDAVLLSVGADLPYFTGYEAMASERPTMLVVRPGESPVLFVPRLEAPRVPAGTIEAAAWDETDDPIALVAERLGDASRVAIGDHTWSRFLLALQGLLPAVSWLGASSLTNELRLRKDPSEIEALRAAASAVDRVLERVPREIRFRGRTERDVAGDLGRMTVAEGHEVSSFAIVAAGPNGASPHHEPTDRVIEAGDVVVCDFGGRWHGYFSDVTRTFVVGPPDDEQREVHRLVLEANTAARAAVRPGVPCQEVDAAARSVIAEAGYGEFFVHRTGHGIGLETHEHPYMVEGNSRPLQPGMCFSIEPGIYLPGRFGVRIEDIVTCTYDGIDELNRAERALVVVE